MNGRFNYFWEHKTLNFRWFMRKKERSEYRDTFLRVLQQEVRITEYVNGENKSRTEWRDIDEVKEQ